ncbi:GatB/YqeY domain-containing protein [Methylococcus sp. EFPC2]|uniref:GatB/YqeY domain-containing protein n=1 Tax=Methylococcus sp. EFPC2 TaxID=2812648 RepID=UPI001966DB0E|nr:GatB/YqeY domain-containing protein [Methylococcus sp. EFPC2]QSA96626.1 GatB/YqeY domain-containing protein [Methylococcus sp. EFPC2]
MSELKQRIQDEMKAAMKAGEKDRLGVIRLILAAVKQREVDERIQLDDTQVIAVLDKMLKQRRESITQYTAAGRQDLADAESAEIRVLQDFLPQALSESEIDALVRDVISETGAAAIADMGKVMALLKPKMQGRADMASVSARIRALLSA